MTEPVASAEVVTASEARPQLVQDAEVIVRDLYFKRLAGSLMPFDEVAS